MIALAKELDMKKWHYRVVAYGPQTVDKKTNKPVNMKELLRRMGQDGWELVSVTPALTVTEGEKKILTARGDSGQGQVMTQLIDMIMIFKKPNVRNS